VTIGPEPLHELTSPCKGEVGGEAAGRGSSTRFARTKAMTHRARRLRADMTETETRLWKALRGRQIDDLQFRRHHAVGRYVFDFYCPAIQLAIEIDGGQHNTPSGQAADAGRTKWLNNKGIAVLRYWNNDVLANLSGVIEDIARLVAERQRSTPPRRASRVDPPLSGEGERGAA
jgi:very-short-patch-repair endonuclease